MLDGGTEDALGGAVFSGALLRDTGVLTNTGTIIVGAGSPALTPSASPGGAARLVDAGLLVNTGLITLHGGLGAAQGGILVDRSLLDNASRGTIDVGGAGVSSDTIAGNGAVLGVAAYATLANAGYIDVQGGIGALGGTLASFGFITNTGLITVRGGDYANTAHAGGGLLLDGGSLLNQGTIFVGSGGRALNLGPNVGGGSLAVVGLLTNDSLLTGGRLLLLGARRADERYRQPRQCRADRDRRRAR